LAFAGLLVSLLLTVASPGVGAAEEGGGGSSPAVPMMAGARVCLQPLDGVLTCYSKQVSGLWARGELGADRTGWEITGVVTQEELITTVGEMLTR
jgi:hypothetical protein